MINFISLNLVMKWTNSLKAINYQSFLRKNHINLDNPISIKAMEFKGLRHCSVVKKPPAKCGRLGSTPDLGRSHMLLQSNQSMCLSCWTCGSEEPGESQPRTYAANYCRLPTTLWAPQPHRQENHHTRSTHHN